MQRKKNLILKDLQDLVCERLDRMLLSNPNRIQYHERYQAIIEDYNSQQDRANIEKTFDELMKLVQSMDQEEQRYVREGFSSDEELSLYDMLFSENLSKQDIQKIKQVAVTFCKRSNLESRSLTTGRISRRQRPISTTSSETHSGTGFRNATMN